MATAVTEQLQDTAHVLYTVILHNPSDTVRCNYTVAYYGTYHSAPQLVDNTSTQSGSYAIWEILVSLSCALQQLSETSKAVDKVQTVDGPVGQLDLP